MMTRIKKNLDHWLKQLAQTMQFNAAHLTPREQKTVVILFWLLSLALSYYLLQLHID